MWKVNQLSLLESPEFSIADTTIDSDQWYTPNTPEQPVLDLMVMALGNSPDGKFGLDPTADPDKRTPARYHFTEADNCLVQECPKYQTIFGNPPFSDPLPFVAWVIAQIQAGRCPQAIMLLKLGALNNQGTGNLIREHASATCQWLHNGRINFIPGDGVIAKLQQEYEQGKRSSPKPSTADFDCVFVNFGCWNHFTSVMDDYGHVQICRSNWKENLVPF